MNDSTVNIPEESSDIVVNVINSFFFPLKTHDANRMNSKTKMNIPARDIN